MYGNKSCLTWLLINKATTLGVSEHFLWNDVISIWENVCVLSDLLVMPTHAEENVLLGSGGCFTNASRALQRNLAKIYNARNHIYSENFKLKICTCAQSKALGTHTKFQLEILIRSAIFAIHKFRENMLESSRNVSETTPWSTNSLWCVECHPGVTGVYLQNALHATLTLVWFIMYC